MPKLFESVFDLESGQAAIRRRAYGIIEVNAGRLSRIAFRPWPKIFTADDVLVRSQFSHRWLVRDACRVYFNQPLAHQRYLAIKYIISNFGTQLTTLRCAMLVADEVARIKRVDAIVCHVASSNISDRLMKRLGWARHLENSPRRQFIKRFYGKYPQNLSKEETRNVGWRCEASYLASFPSAVPCPPQDSIHESFERRMAEVEIE